MAVDPADELASLPISDILDADSRPTFVIDLDPDELASSGSDAIVPVFCNAALRSHERLLDAITSRDPDAQAPPSGGPAVGAVAATKLSPATAFRAWATGVTPHDDSKDVFPLSCVYADMLWTGSTVRQRWRLISGNRLWRADSDQPIKDLSSGVPPEVATGGLRAAHAKAAAAAAEAAEAAQASEPAPPRDSTRGAETTASASSKRSKPSFYPSTTTGSDETAGSSQATSIVLSTAPEKAVADWTVPNPKGSLSDHIKLARSINWSTTPLGAMESWSPEFRQTANLCMNSPFPVALFWGSELTMLYNEAYAAEVAGNKHPSLMGTGFSGPFAELWDYAGPVFAECARTGISVRKENDYLPIDRHGLLEETHFSWSFTPL